MGAHVPDLADADCGKPIGGAPARGPAHSRIGISEVGIPELATAEPEADLGIRASREWDTSCPCYSWLRNSATFPRRAGSRLRWSRFFGQVVKVDSRTEQEAPRWPEGDGGSHRSSRHGAHPEIVTEMYAAAIDELERRGTDPGLIAWLRNGGEGELPANAQYWDGYPGPAGFRPYFFKTLHR